MCILKRDVQLCVDPFVHGESFEHNKPYLGNLCATIHVNGEDSEVPCNDENHVVLVKDELLEYNCSGGLQCRMLGVFEWKASPKYPEPMPVKPALYPEKFYAAYVENRHALAVRIQANDPALRKSTSTIPDSPGVQGAMAHLEAKKAGRAA